jgi:uncharacterized lipoprotein
MKQFNVTLLSLWAVATLSACSTAREQFDFSKKSPDEFAVVKRAPLEMPSSMNLPPPRPGAPRPQEAAATQQAKQVLFGRSATETTPSSTTSGESILLQRSGANNVSADIRNRIDEETIKEQEENISTFNKILGRTGSASRSSNDIINPTEELKRLEQQQQ